MNLVVDNDLCVDNLHGLYVHTAVADFHTVALVDLVKVYHTVVLALDTPFDYYHHLVLALAGNFEVRYHAVVLLTYHLVADFLKPYMYLDNPDFSGCLQVVVAHQLGL